MPILLPHQAQNLASPLPPLLVEAERIARVVDPGLHGRRRAGAGETFWQFRRYEAGDPAERIDWRQSARSDKIFIREREWEAAQTVYLWADDSGSMHYSSDKNFPSKAYRAQLLLFALANLLLRGGEKIIWQDGDNTAVRSKAALEALAAKFALSRGDNLPPDMPLYRNAHTVLASDFLTEPEKLTLMMQRYTAQHVKGVLLHILDPLEEVFSLQGRVEMQGLENEAPLLLQNAASLQDTYDQKMREHTHRLQRLAQNAGWRYVRDVTSDKPQTALLRVCYALSLKRGR